MGAAGCSCGGLDLDIAKTCQDFVGFVENI